MRRGRETSHHNPLRFRPPRWLRVLLPLAPLATFRLVPPLVASSLMPPGFEHQAWAPLRDDPHALSAIRRRSGRSFVSPGQDPLHARYVLWGGNVAFPHRLNVPDTGPPQEVPERPPRYRSLRRSRPGIADDCPQEVANALPRGRAIENAVLTWRERTPQGGRQATLTVWRAVRASTSRLICVESSRTLSGP